VGTAIELIIGLATLSIGNADNETSMEDPAADGNAVDGDTEDGNMKDGDTTMNSLWLM
jgi:hypothetical protein